MATEIQVPSLGESVTQAVLVAWRKGEGEVVAVDEAICELETDKANVDLPAKAAGVLHQLKKEGETVKVGEVIATIDEAGAAQRPAPTASVAPVSPASATSPAPPPAAAAMDEFSPAVRRLVAEHQVDVKAVSPTGPGGRITKEDVERYLAERQAPLADTGSKLPVAPHEPAAPGATGGLPARVPAGATSAPAKLTARPLAPPTTPSPAPAPALPPPPPAGFDAAGIRREPMSKLRKRVAERLVEAQHTAAILTTFNEIDLTEVIALRARYKERFQELHGVGLGFMSFFARATVLALREVPRLNAFIDGDEVVYHNYVNLGLAVSTERGLVVPVLRNAQDMSFARIEAEIKRMAGAVREGKLSLEELSGGTFAITNGGVFGSLLSTPILTPPQSGILGMHAIQKRPVVVNDKIEVRSMMYVAVSYDHRLVDGKDAITFLVRIKQLLEDPNRMVLEV